MAFPTTSPPKRSFQDMVEPECPSPAPQSIQHSVETTGPSQPAFVTEPPAKPKEGQQEQQDRLQAARETSTLTSISVTPPPPQLDGTADSVPAPQPAKRRKLTPAEKQAREQEKSEKRAKKEEDSARKAEEKQRKDEEKLQKDEERRQKNEEREEKKRERDLEKQKRDEKKRQEDEEKQRKERVSLDRFATFILLLTVFQAQMRMTSFFAKPIFSPRAGDTLSDSAPNDDSSAVAFPLEGNDAEDEAHGSTKSTPKKKRATDYKRTFLPFALPKNAALAPTNHFTWDAEATENSRMKADSWFEHGTIQKDGQARNRTGTLHELLDLSPLGLVERGLTHATTKELLERASGPSKDESNVNGSDPLCVLREIPMKYVHFHEDVRPPYVGSFRGTKSKKDIRKLARNPHSRLREELEYDEDSEAEWEEPEEGEDIDSEGESDLDSADGADELDDFLDDAEDGFMPRKKAMVGDMKPVSSGLCWVDEKGHVEQPHHSSGIDLRDLRMETLSGMSLSAWMKS